jgi:hypothetical protein
LDKSKGRILERSDSESYIKEKTERYHLHKESYLKVQATVEHQFGIIKRQWGFDDTLLKTKEKVEGEFAIIFTCFKLRRSVFILGVTELIKRLKVGCSKVLKKCSHFSLIKVSKKGD